MRKAEGEVLANKRNPAYGAPVNSPLAAERKIARVVAMPVGHHHVVDFALRDKTLNVAACPFAAIFHPIRHRRHILHVLCMMRVAAVEKHRRTVWKDEERLFADAGVDQMDVQLASARKDEYGRSVGVAEIELPDGIYDGSVVTEETHPI